MAQNVITALVDDIDGGPADQTVIFSLDGQPLEIDLNDNHAARLREALAPYILEARHVAGPRPNLKLLAANIEAGQQRPKRGRGKPPAPLPQFSEPTTGRAKRTSLRPDAASVRAWAESQRIELKPRGRIPKHVTDRYIAASQSAR